MKSLTGENPKRNLLVKRQNWELSLWNFRLKLIQAHSCIAEDWLATMQDLCIFVCTIVTGNYYGQLDYMDGKAL